MKLLRDEEIVNRITSDLPIVSGLTAPTDWYSKHSPVQACSLDLHVGKIYLPTTSTRSYAFWRTQKSSMHAYQQHILEPGHTAVIVTSETLRFPANLAAFGFPLSRVSFKGILMTNPGHVDPGYIGHMRFTIINMSKTPYVLRQGDPIVTLLLFELDKPSNMSWSNRNAQAGTAPDPSIEDLARLSKQFLDIDNRARSVCEKLVKGAEFRIRVLTPVIAGVAGALISVLLVVGQRMINEDPVDNLNHEVIALREQLNTLNLGTRLTALERIVMSTKEETE